MSLCKAVEKNYKTLLAWNRDKKRAERLAVLYSIKKRIVIHHVFNHIQVLNHKGKSTERWLNTLSRLTGILRRYEV